MNIRFNISDNPIFFLKESISFSLTAQQKKVIIVVGLALSCLAACYAIMRVCCFQAKKLEEEEDLEADKMINLNTDSVISSGQSLSEEEKISEEDEDLNEEITDPSVNFGTIYKHSGQFVSPPSNKVDYRLLDSNPLRANDFQESPDMVLTPVPNRRKGGNQSHFLVSTLSGDNLHFGELSPVETVYSPTSDLFHNDSMTPTPTGNKERRFLTPFEKE